MTPFLSLTFAFCYSSENKLLLLKINYLSTIDISSKIVPEASPSAEGRILPMHRVMPTDSVITGGDDPEVPTSVNMDIKLLVCMCFIATRKNLGFYISVVHSFQVKLPKRGLVCPPAMVPAHFGRRQRPSSGMWTVLKDMTYPTCPRRTHRHG